jgi:hypothetical protein
MVLGNKKGLFDPALLLILGYLCGSEISRAKASAGARMP